MSILGSLRYIKGVQTLRPKFRLLFHKPKTISQERLSQNTIEALTEGRARSGCLWMFIYKWLVGFIRIEIW